MASREPAPARPEVRPGETLARVAGGPLDPEPYLSYLEQKVGAVYGLG